MDGEIGSAYGIAIQIKKAEREKIYNAIKEDKHSKVDQIPLDKWKPIRDDWYPLYWGKDKYAGSRINAHARTRKSTGTLQINKREYLDGAKLIYGVVLCDKYSKIEKQLQRQYPCLLKTYKG